MIKGAQFGAVDSPIEAHFARDARALKLPAWVRNYCFLEGRKYELDFAWPRLKCGIEIDGHVHRIRDRFDSDREKGALAILAGWTVMHVTGEHVRDGRAIAWARQLLDLLSRPGNGSDAPPHMLACGEEPGHRNTLIRPSELSYGRQP